MKKLLNFWYLRLRNKVRNRFTEGGFEFIFREYDLIIRSLSGSFEVRILSTEYAYGYLLSALVQDKIDTIHGYAVYMYMIASGLCREERFVRELNEVIDGYCSRQLEKVSEKISEEEDLEALETQQVLDGLSKLSKKQRKKLFKK